MATSGDLTVALIIRADAAQARAELALTQAQLKGMEDAAKSGADGFAAYNASLGDITTAQRTAAAAAGGSVDALHGVSGAYTAASDAMAQGAVAAETAAARFDAVMGRERAAAAAWEEQQKAARAEAKAASAARADEEIARRKAALANAESTEAQEVAATNKVVQAQNAASEAYAAGRAPLTALDAAIARKSITTEESEELENALTASHERGAITDAEYTESINALANAKIKDVAATEAQVVAQKEASAATSGFKMNSRMGYSATALVSDVASGQFSRSKRELAALANESGLFAKLLSPVGLMIGGVVAALGTLAVAFAKGEAETAAFSNALIMTGGYAGKSSADLQALSIQLGKLTDSTQHAASEVVTQVAATGKFYGDQVQMVSEAALQMQEAVGQSVATTIKQFEALGQDPVQGVLKLNDSMHFLTQAVYDQITALVQEGQTDQAAEVAQRAYAQAVAQRTASVRQNVGLLQSAWAGLKDVVKGAWNAMIDVGRSDAGASLAMWQRQLKAAQQNLATPGLDNGAIRAFMQQANQAQAEIDKLSGKSAQDAKQVSDTLKAEQDLAKGGLTALQRYNKELQQYTNDYKQALTHGTPQEIAAAQSALNVHVDELNRQLAAASKQPKAHHASGLGIDRAQLSADVSAVQDQLRILQSAWQNTQRTLASEHTAGALSDKQYFDDLRKDLDTYTKERLAALEKEKQAARGHITTQADRIRADQKVASIDAQISQTTQNAAAKREEINAQEKKSVEALTRAWQQFQASVGQPVQMHTAEALKKLKELYAWIQKLKGTKQEPTGDQVDGMLSNILMTGVPKNVRLHSLRNIPGYDTRSNPLAAVGEDRQNEQANFAAQQRQLAANYAAAQKAALGNNQKMLQLQTNYQKDSQALANNHKQAMAMIDKAQYWGRLEVASNVLGQLASLSSSHNAKIAAIGKAAAVANALIKTYESATEAYSSLAGIPYVGPELGAAAAAMAIAAGMANVAQIRSQNTGGYAEGGYTGAGGRYDVAGVVHAGEGVLSAPEVSSLGGEAGFNALRANLRNGFAEGGYVHPLANAPSPAQLGFSTQSTPTPSMDIRALAAANETNSRAQAPVNVKTVIVQNADQLASEILNTPTGTKLVIQHVSNNPRSIQGKWRSG